MRSRTSFIGCIAGVAAGGVIALGAAGAAWADAPDADWPLPTNVFTVALAVSSDGAFVYQAPFNGPMARLDSTTGAATTFGSTGAFRGSIAPSADGSLLYTGGANPTPAVQVWSTVGAAPPTLVTSTPTPGDFFDFDPTDAALSTDGSTLWIANYYSNSVSRLSTATDAILPPAIAVGTNPGAIIVGSASIYVANHNSNSVSVISPATNAVIATIPVGTAPRELALSPDGATLYVTNQLAGSVSVIDTASNTVTATWALGPVSGEPFGAAVTPDGQRLLIGTDDNGTLLVISTADGSILAAVDLNDNTHFPQFSPDGATLYVSHEQPGAIEAIAVFRLPVVIQVSAPEVEDVVGATVDLEAAATGTSVTGAVQWQVEDGDGWTDVPGASTTTFSPTVGAAEARYRMVVFSDIFGAVPGEPFTVTPLAGPDPGPPPAPAPGPAPAGETSALPPTGIDRGPALMLAALLFALGTIQKWRGAVQDAAGRAAGFRRPERRRGR